MSTSEIRAKIREAADLIETAGWAQFLLEDARSGGYCTVGAIRHVTGGRYGGNSVYDQAIALVAKELRAQGFEDVRDKLLDDAILGGDQELADYDLVTTWNDDDVRTVDEVLRLLREVGQG